MAVLWSVVGLGASDNGLFLKPGYDFIKLENDLLVVDPMDSTVVAVIPRKFPNPPTTHANLANQSRNKYCCL